MRVIDRKYITESSVSGLLSAANSWQKRGSSDTGQPGSELCPTKRGREADVCEPLSGNCLYPCSFPQARGHNSRARKISRDGHDLVERHWNGMLVRGTSALPSGQSNSACDHGRRVRSNPATESAVITERACIILRHTGSQSDTCRTAEVEIDDVRPTAAGA